METLDRYTFRQRYKTSPSRLNKEDEIIVKGKTMKVKKRIYAAGSGFPTEIIYRYRDRPWRLDMAPHWERIPDTPIHSCNDGMVNLIRAVYKQTADDLGEFYKGDYKSMPLERVPGETASHWYKRLHAARKGEVRRCEQFLGSVLSRQVMIRSLWELGKTVDEIAKEIGSTPDHVAAIIDRLGFNRSETDEDDPYDF